MPFDAFCINFQTLFGNLTLHTLLGYSFGLPPLLISLILINYPYSICVIITYLMKVLNYFMNTTQKLLLMVGSGFSFIFLIIYIYAGPYTASGLKFKNLFFPENDKYIRLTIISGFNIIFWSVGFFLYKNK